MNEERRCLVIDEQPAVRLGVRELLADRYEVEEAADGQGALELLTLGRRLRRRDRRAGARRQRRPDDAARGSAAIRALRQAQPGLGIVAHGARPERHAASEAIEAGATAYVAKSSPTEALARAVDAAAERSSFVDPAAAQRAAAAR